MTGFKVLSRYSNPLFFPIFNGKLAPARINYTGDNYLDLISLGFFKNRSIIPIELRAMFVSPSKRSNSSMTTNLETKQKKISIRNNHFGVVYICLTLDQLDKD